MSSECWYSITDILPQSHVMVVYGRYPDFLKIHDVLLQRMESRFIPSVNLEQSAQTSDRKSHFYHFLLLPRLEAQSFVCFLKDHWQFSSLPCLIPGGSTWLCTGVIKDCLWRQWATRQLSSKRTLSLVIMTGKRQQDLQLEKSFYICKPNTLDMKITSPRAVAVLCSSCRLLSKQGYAFSRDRQVFRAHTSSVSKCMHHCGWINKYPLKEPGSEE